MKQNRIPTFTACICIAALMTGCSSDTTRLPSAKNLRADTNRRLPTVTVSNPSKVARELEPDYFSFYDLDIDQRAVQDLTVTLQGEAVPSQAIDRDGDDKDDGLLVLLNFAPAETHELAISTAPPVKVVHRKLTQAEISRKTGGKWHARKDNPALQEYVGGQFENVQQLTPPPQHTDHSWFIRYEGPGIESDKVGYRIYLDERNGFDIFGKKTRDMILQDVGQDGFNSYHEMSDWGMDILKVGQSFGAGGYGFWNGETVQLVSQVDGWDVKIVENGDLYSAVQIVYKNWRVADKSVNLSANLSMYGGSRLVHTRLKSNDSLPSLAIGLVKHPNTELIEGAVDVTGQAYTYVASWGKQSLNDDNLGMALLFRAGHRKQQTTDANNYVSVMDPAGNDLDYYFLAAWEQEQDGIKIKEDFVAYLENEARRLTLTPRVQITTGR